MRINFGIDVEVFNKWCKTEAAQHFYSRFSTPSYYQKTLSNILESILGQLCSNKKDMIDTIHYLNNENNYFLLEAAFYYITDTIQEKKTDYLYFGKHSGKRSFIDTILSIQDLKDLDDKLKNLLILDKAFLNKLFKKIDYHNIESFFVAFSKGFVLERSNLFNESGAMHFDISKKSLNILINILTHTHDSKCFEKIIENISFVKTNDPTLKNVSISQLNNEIKSYDYSQNLIDKINHIISNDDYCSMTSNIFQFAFDIDKISAIRKENNLHLGGEKFITKAHELLQLAKNNNMSFFKDYLSITEDIEKMKFQSGKGGTAKLYDTDRVLVQHLRKIEFHYDDQNDLNNKKEAFHSFLNFLLKNNLKESDDFYLKNLEKIALKSHLNNLIPESQNSRTSKNNKI